MKPLTKELVEKHKLKFLEVQKTNLTSYKVFVCSDCGIRVSKHQASGIFYLMDKFKGTTDRLFRCAQSEVDFLKSFAGYVSDFVSSEVVIDDITADELGLVPRYNHSYFTEELSLDEYAISPDISKLLLPLANGNTLISYWFWGELYAKYEIKNQ